MIQKNKKAKLCCVAVLLIVVFFLMLISAVAVDERKSMVTRERADAVSVLETVNEDMTDFDWYVPTDALTADVSGSGGAVLTGIKQEAMEKRFDARDFFMELVDITLSIPAEIEVDGNMLPVTEIAANAFNIPNWAVATPWGGENYSYIFRIINVDFSEAANLVKIGERAFFRNQITLLDLTGATSLAEIGYNALTWHHQDGDDDYIGDGSNRSPWVIHAGMINDIGNLFTLGLDTEIFIAADESSYEHYYNDYLPAKGYKWLSNDKVSEKGLEYREIFDYLTYEVEVQFLHDDGTDAAPPETKLFGLPYSYVKTKYLNYDNYWQEDPDYSLPATERPRNSIAMWCYKMGGMGGSFYRAVDLSSATAGYADRIYWHAEEFSGVYLDEPGVGKLPDIYTSFDAAAILTILMDSGEFAVYAEQDMESPFSNYKLDFYTLEVGGGTLKEGENTIIITADDFETQLTISAALWQVTDFTVDMPPQRLSYSAYQTLDASGISLIGQYNDGQVLPLTDYAVVYQHGDCLLAGDTKVYIDVLLAGGASIRKELDISVAKATYDLADLGITFQDTEVAYDGKSKSLKVSGQLPEGVTVYYDISGVTAPACIK